MKPTAPADEHEIFLKNLLATVERIALGGDLDAVQPLLAMTSTQPAPPLLASLAEAFARMVVKLEAREFELECRIDELLQLKKELEQANYDPLTGLPNRVIARDRLQQGLQQTRRSGGHLAVLYLDLDRFKWINDNLGHAAGDELLRQVAHRLSQCARKADTVARLGGDEFLCVLPDMETPSAAEDLSKRIIHSLSQPFALQAGTASIGASIGIALFPAHGEATDSLIACADKALYQSKNAGRNRYSVYSGD